MRPFGMLFFLRAFLGGSERVDWAKEEEGKLREVEVEEMDALKVTKRTCKEIIIRPGLNIFSWQALVLCFVKWIFVLHTITLNSSLERLQEAFLYLNQGQYHAPNNYGLSLQIMY